MAPAWVWTWISVGAAAVIAGFTGRLWSLMGVGALILAVVTACCVRWRRRSFTLVIGGQPVRWHVRAIQRLPHSEFTELVTSHQELQTWYHRQIAREANSWLRWCWNHLLALWWPVHRRLWGERIGCTHGQAWTLARVDALSERDRVALRQEHPKLWRRYLRVAHLRTVAEFMRHPNG